MGNIEGEQPGLDQGDADDDEAELPEEWPPSLREWVLLIGAAALLMLLGYLLWQSGVEIDPQ